jgi:hypothetical protein
MWSFWDKGVSRDEIVVLWTLTLAQWPLTLKFPSALYLPNECRFLFAGMMYRGQKCVTWLKRGDVTLQSKIKVLLPFTFALHSTCQFSVLHQAVGILSCFCPHKHVSSSYFIDLMERGRVDPVVLDFNNRSTTVQLTPAWYVGNGFKWLRKQVVFNRCLSMAVSKSQREGCTTYWRSVKSWRMFPWKVPI